MKVKFVWKYPHPLENLKTVIQSMVTNLYIQRIIRLRSDCSHWNTRLVSWTYINKEWRMWHQNAFPPSLLHWCPPHLCSGTNKTTSINLTYSVWLTPQLHVLMSLGTIMIASKTFSEKTDDNWMLKLFQVLWLSTPQHTRYVTTCATSLVQCPETPFSV